MAAPSRRLTLPLRIACIVAIALAAEIFLFNVNFWTTLGNDPVVLTDDATVIDSADDALEFTDLDTPVSNIRITFADDQADQPVYANYSITDDGTSEAYDLPAVEMLPSNSTSCTQNLHAYGNLTSLRITFPQSSAYNEDSGEQLQQNSYPLTIESIELDTVRPFSFNLLRFALLAGILLLLYALRPKSALHRLPALDTGRMARGARGTALALALGLVCVGVLSHANWVSIATPFYNADDWDGSAPVTLIQQDWYWDYGNSEYDELAHSLAQGSLSLDLSVPDWLSQVDDPYDPGIRDQMGAQTGEWAMGDAAYYDGSYYVYFGIVPELLCYLPFYLITGCDLPNALAVLVGALLFTVGLFALLRACVRRWFPRTSLGVFLLVYAGVFACSGLLFGLSRPTLYQVPFAFARAFVVWGLFLWLRGLEATGNRSRIAFVAGGSLCMALVAGCRPQFLLFALFAIPLAIALWRRGKGNRAAPLCAIAVPFALVALGLMWYNAVRFGSPFDFGASRNLAGNNMTLRGNDPARLVDGLFAYFIQPAQATTSFPFLQVADASTTYEGMTIIEPMAGGVLACQPFLWTALAAAGTRRRRPLLFWTVAALAAAAVVLCCFDIQASGILGRYYQDFSLFLAFAAALATLSWFGSPTADSPTGPDKPDAMVAPAREQSLPLKLLYAATAATMAYFLLVFFLSFDNSACNTMAGSDPATWEYLRQTFCWWL